MALPGSRPGSILSSLHDLTGWVRSGWVGSLTRGEDGQFQTASPFLTWLQCNRFLNCSSINTQHLFVVFVPEIDDGFRFLLPWIPHHCMIRNQNSNNHLVLIKEAAWLYCLKSEGIDNITNIWKSFLSYNKCAFSFMIKHGDEI